MKKLLTFLAVLALSAGGTIADCGMKTTNTGTLKSYDAEAKAIVVTEGDKEVKLEITDKTKGTDKLNDMVGKNVKVVSEHGKADSVEADAS